MGGCGLWGLWDELWRNRKKISFGKGCCLGPRTGHGTAPQPLSSNLLVTTSRSCGIPKDGRVGLEAIVHPRNIKNFSINCKVVK